MKRSRISSPAFVLTMLAAGAGLLHAAQKTAPKSGGNAKAKKPEVTSLPPISPVLHAALQDRKYEAAVANRMSADGSPSAGLERVQLECRVLESCISVSIRAQAATAKRDAV